MRVLMSDSYRRRRLKKLILFTSEKNDAAQRLYESLGFERFGEFGLLFGTRGQSGNA